MSDIVQELTIGTVPEKAFNALTQAAGISEWWSNHVSATPELGSITEVSFENGGVFKMEVSNLQTNQKVEWKVRFSPHDWEGSTITWDIAPIAEGIRLVFSQRDLVVGKTGYTIEETRAGWEYFLNSLKAYLETGKGTPYVY